MKSLTRLAIACLALCATPLACAQKPIEGYTCCNLHYDKDWISDANWLHAPMIPAGARIRVLSYDANNRANVEIDGKPMRIGQDYGRKEESLETFISKLVVKMNPRSKIDRYPGNVRSAIKDGKVIAGMTREQVIISVGYPPTHRTPTLDSPVWHHWQSKAGRFEVRWDDKGRVKEILGQK